MPRRNKKYKGKKGKDPESSTPETSINSVDDDTQQLLRSGAGASTDGRKSRADEKSKKDSRCGLQRNPLNYKSLDAASSKNSAQCGHSTDPDPESSKSPTKKHSLSPFRNPWGKKSPNRSPGIECSCEVGNHKPECPKSKDLPFDPKGAIGGARPKTYSAKKDENVTKSSSSFREAISKAFSANKDKAGTKSSSSLAGERQKTSSAKKNNGAQSSSSSDPSHAEYFASASESQQSSDRSLLLDPNQGAELRHEKITHTTRMRDKFKTKRQGNRSSGTESSFEDKTKEELKCPEKRKHKMDLRSKSLKGKTTSMTTSSSGSSTSTKKKNSGESYQLPRCLNSKGKRPLKGPSGKKSSNESKSNAGSSSNSTDLNIFEEHFERSKREEGTPQGAIGANEKKIQTDVDQEPEIQTDVDQEPEIQTDVDQEPEIQTDEILIDQMDLGRRRRISSLSARSHLQEPEPNLPDPYQETFNLSQMNAEIRAINLKRVEERNRRVENQEIDADEEMDANEERKASIDENERILLRRLRRVERPDPTVLRNPSSSPVRVRPCSCRAATGKRIGHHPTCDQKRDLSKLIRQRKNRFA